MELIVYSTSGTDTGKKVQVADSIVNAEPNDHAIYLDVKQYMANQRQGTHKSKERSEMSGSTKKLGKQKGGGGARRGDINSPLLHGGARVFGPRPRDYSFKLNKKVKRLARLSALAYKFKENNVTVVEDFSFEAPKTKKMVEILKNLNLSEKKSLLVLAEPNNFVFLSSRNLPRIRVANVSNLNTYEILNAKNIVFVESSAKKL
ncbi:MAG: 50S ribosomal protein L4, partial [Bacteroidetes bacterium]|nr:50S ribosomal protein L4 [Candidatus Pullibacteroides excrementavium]